MAEMLRQQSENSTAYVLPFIEKTKAITAGLKVLEIGCGEGGVLKPFLDKGCICVGVDLDTVRIPRALNNFTTEVASGQATFLVKNIYDDDFVSKYKNYFDLIILKDVIEHVPDQKKFIGHFKNLLAPNGQVFFGFPPWWMPFGGHQQLCAGFLSKLPWYHLLPNFLYKGLLKLGGESDAVINELLEIKTTRILIEELEAYSKANNFKIVNRQWYLINPIYKYKFGLEPRKQFALLGAFPYLRNIWTTCAYYTISV
jgi:SAM-dependent methyltransferase